MKLKRYYSIFTTLHTDLVLWSGIYRKSSEEIYDAFLNYNKRISCSIVAIQSIKKHNSNLQLIRIFNLHQEWQTCEPDISHPIPEALWRFLIN